MQGEDSMSYNGPIYYDGPLMSKEESDRLITRSQLLYRRDPLSRDGAFAPKLVACQNKLCDRLVPEGILFCCCACDRANETKSDPATPEDGAAVYEMFGHSGGCTWRWTKRQEAVR